MTSTLTRNMLYILIRSVASLVEDTPANCANGVLLQHCKETLVWLQTQAQKVKIRQEMNETLTTTLIAVNKKADAANELSKSKQGMYALQPHKVEPLILVNLLEAWDRDFPGGSAAVIGTLDEILSSVNDLSQD